MVARYVAERGYYVMPSAMVDAVLQSQGITDAGMVSQIKPERFREVFGADATLYSTVFDWSTKYMVLASTVTVGVEMRLVDNDSGAVLWRIKRALQRKSDSGGGGGSPIGALIAMTVSAAVHAAVQDYRPIAEQNVSGLATSLPPGVHGLAFTSWKADRKAKEAAEKPEGVNKKAGKAAEYRKHDE